MTLTRSPESVLVGSGDGGWVHRAHVTRPDIVRRGTKRTRGKIGDRGPVKSESSTGCESGESAAQHARAVQVRVGGDKKERAPQTRVCALNSALRTQW